MINLFLFFLDFVLLMIRLSLYYHIVFIKDEGDLSEKNHQHVQSDSPTFLEKEPSLYPDQGKLLGGSSQWDYHTKSCIKKRPLVPNTMTVGLE